MKNKIFVYLSFLISFFIFISLAKNWLSLVYWSFWLGGAIGMILPEIDHLVYVFFANPQEVTSQRVRFLCGNKQLKNCFWLLATTTAERTRLIFHTVVFQIIFFVLSFWVISSSNSLLGRGMVLAFGLHLILDQVNQVLEKGNLDGWFWQIPVSLDRKQTNIYLIVGILLLLFLGFFL